MRFRQPDMEKQMGLREDVPASALHSTRLAGCFCQPDRAKADGSRSRRSCFCSKQHTAGRTLQKCRRPPRIARLEVRRCAVCQARSDGAVPGAVSIIICHFRGLGHTMLLSCLT